MLCGGVLVFAVGLELLSYVWQPIGIEPLFLKLQSVVVFVLVEKFVLASSSRTWVICVKVPDV